MVPGKAVGIVDKRIEHIKEGGGKSQKDTGIRERLKEGQVYSKDTNDNKDIAKDGQESCSEQIVCCVEGFKEGRTEQWVIRHLADVGKISVNHFALSGEGAGGTVHLLIVAKRFGHTVCGNCGKEQSECQNTYGIRVSDKHLITQIPSYLGDYTIISADSQGTA